MNEMIYYYDEKNIYYKPFYINDVIVNEDNIYIYDELSYQQNKFNDDNELINNNISSQDDPELFNFINNSLNKPL